MTPEGRVKAAVKNIFKKYKPKLWYYMPVSAGYGAHGIPDFICCCNGWFFGLECKADDGEIEPIQALQIAAIQLADGFTLVVYGCKDMPVLEAHINMMMASVRR